MTDAELKSELLIIDKWFKAFNNNHPDVKGRFPSSTVSFPAAVMLATSELHHSTTRPYERIHISGRLSNTIAWGTSPKENHCCVHIYAKNDDVTEGFDTWRLKNKSRSKLSSLGIQAKVAAALANNRGVLGVGNLA
ncbi:hypothetical protein PsYK624_005000 [Phanerochaete sordida]|uniref:Uncharacterized protein n=1 Tax=Phanerochaete sordida TaxID=48140 RepID=A0A9P3FYB5_9APHY|nr:hypothetical protein PsYK624_005000 [Phanerochaete sordida]